MTKDEFEKEILSVLPDASLPSVGSAAPGDEEELYVDVHLPTTWGHHDFPIIFTPRRENHKRYWIPPSDEIDDPNVIFGGSVLEVVDSYQEYVRGLVTYHQEILNTLQTFSKSHKE